MDNNTNDNEEGKKQDDPLYKTKQARNVATMVFLHLLQNFITMPVRMEILMPYFNYDTARYSTVLNRSLLGTYLMSLILNPLMLELSNIYGRLPVIQFGMYYSIILKAFSLINPSGNMQILTSFLSAPGMVTLNSFNVYMSDLYKSSTNNSKEQADIDSKQIAVAQSQVMAYKFIGLVVGPVVGGYLSKRNVRLPYVAAIVAGLIEIYLGQGLNEYMPIEKRKKQIDYHNLNPLKFLKLFLSGGKLISLSIMHVLYLITNPRGYGTTEDLVRTVSYGSVNFDVMQRSYLKSFSSFVSVLGYGFGGKILKQIGVAKMFITSSYTLILQRLYQWLYCKSVSIDYILNVINVSKPLTDVSSNVMLRQEAREQGIKPDELEIMLGNLEEMSLVFSYPCWAIVYGWCLRSGDVRRFYGILAGLHVLQNILGLYVLKGGGTRCINEKSNK